MRALIFGGSGTIGTAVAQRLDQAGYEVLSASRSGTYSVDTNDPESIQTLYERVGTVDAVISAIGGGPFVPVSETQPEQIQDGLAGKLAGQMHLVVKGLPFVNDHGSVTLISGILNKTPVPGGTIAGTINGGLEAFVHIASHELPRSIRLNAVSPTVVEESLAKYGAVFPGFEPVPVARVAEAYLRLVAGRENGKILRLH